MGSVRNLEYYKWNIYMFRWFLREYYFNRFLRRHFLVKYFHKEPVMPFYANKITITRNKTNKIIADLINGDKPFMVSRFGNTELQNIVCQKDIEINGISKKREDRRNSWFRELNVCAGFFPASLQYLPEFCNLMIESFKEVDLLGMWHCKMEDYMITTYNKKVQMSHLYHLEPWLADANPWSKALEGKKVLVIHPFDDTIKSQYGKRDKIFENKDILPEFQLITLRAVQTIGDKNETKFENWFEALDYMFFEAVKIDFDVAIIGCGAYGMPLAAKLKKAGKKVIHLGGATQLLFGIKGKRWENNYPTKIASLFNEYWTYPSESETPSSSINVESGCYWK